MLNAPLLRFTAVTCKPVPFTKPGVLLYSKPYALTGVHPVKVREPFNMPDVPATIVLPVTTVGAVFTPAAAGVTGMPAMPPPLTIIFSL